MSFTQSRASDFRPQQAGYWTTVMNDDTCDKLPNDQHFPHREAHLQPRTTHLPILQRSSRSGARRTVTADGQNSFSPLSKLRMDPYGRVERRDKTQFVCSRCRKVFKRNYDLNQHISAVHEKNRPFRCPHCTQAFAHMGTLSKHVRTVHLGEKPFVCKGCNLKFSERGNLNKHLSRNSICRDIEQRVPSSQPSLSP